MRYTLRNRDKLKKAFGVDFYNVLENSLDWAVIANRHHETEFEQLDSGHDKFKMIQVKEINGDRIFEFYVVSITFDCWVLGFKQVKN